MTPGFDMQPILKIMTAVLKAPGIVSVKVMHELYKHIAEILYGHTSNIPSCMPLFHQLLNILLYIVLSSMLIELCRCLLFLGHLRAVLQVTELHCTAL